MSEISKEALDILKLIKKFLEENPEQRFAQALINLNIFSDTVQDIPPEKDYSALVHDIYYDSDKDILKRAENSYQKLNKRGK